MVEEISLENNFEKQLRKEDGNEQKTLDLIDFFRIPEITKNGNSKANSKASPFFKN